MNHVTFEEKWILYTNQWWPAQWLDWKEAAKHFPKPSLHQKKSLGHWRSATSLIDYSFLNPNETIISENYAQQINEMHWKLQCLQPALINKGPNSPWQRPTAQPTLQKLNELGYKVLPHLPFSPDLLPTDYYFFKHLLTTFCRVNASTSSRRQKMLFKSLSNPEAQIFTLQV